MAGTKTIVTALRRTPYSNDGFTILEAKPGETFQINSDLVQGLVDEKFVKRLASGGLVANAEPPAMVGEASPEMVTTTAPDQNISSSDIPADWRDMHHLQIIKLAKSVAPDVKSKAEAIAVLEAEEAKAKG